MRSVIIGLMAVSAAQALVGCKSSSSAVGPTYGSEEGRAIAELVERVNDDKSNVVKLRKMFAEGAVPKDQAVLRKFPTLYYEVRGNPQVTGTTAVATVTMRSESGNSDDKREMEWSFVKEGEEWKIQSAPLP